MTYSPADVYRFSLSATLDFGAAWYGVPCSADYFAAIAPVFERLAEMSRRGTKWNEVTDKAEAVYVPILEAFKEEIVRASAASPDFPKRIVEYLLGKYDFYKITGKDRERETDVVPFNIHGTLNKNGKTVKRLHVIGKTELPTKLIAVRFKDNSATTVEMYFNKGWQFSFRLHSASKVVEPSLKFDIQSSGLPASVVQCAFVAKWR